MATLTCHGCKHCWYSAPGGQLPLKPYPHSRCLALDRDIPMIVGEHQKWLGSDVPADCPVHHWETQASACWEQITRDSFGKLYSGPDQFRSVLAEAAKRARGGRTALAAVAKSADDDGVGDCDA